MKKFKSIKRAIRRGHLEVTMDAATNKPMLWRKSSKGNKVRYFL